MIAYGEHGVRKDHHILTLFNALRSLRAIYGLQLLTLIPQHQLNRHIVTKKVIS